ncbi:MAG TPA: hypothetical protein VGY56_08225 [Verrucomicrobiae bacterium]|nr:hypothetical protein [Verrucomicrobiae bacterium]
MSKVTSPYYPPRARWYARLFNVTDAVRRGVYLDRIRLPSSVTWPGLALTFLVPGLGFYLRGPRIFGYAAMSACGLLFLVFIAWFGHPLANFAFGLMVSTHTSSIVYYCGPALQVWELRSRLLFTVLVLMSLGFLLYGPIRDFIEFHFLMPLQINGHVVVVRRQADANNVKRGDWVAYHISYSTQYGDDAWVQIHSGTGFGPVLGVAGDVVEFSSKGFSVNGVRRPSLPYMPAGGSFIVSTNQWFIWPSYSVSGHGYQSRVSDVMLNLAKVSEEQYAGKPLKHWLWRKQDLQNLQ